MKIITTIEATTDAEQEEVARLLAMLTGVSVTTTKAKVANPGIAEPRSEQLRHQIRALVHSLVQQGCNHQVRLALQSFNGAEKISEVEDCFLAELLEKLHGIGEEEV